jgi:hypothetical protein
MARIVVIGDIGGHPDHLHRALTGVGVRGAYEELPDDVTVIQVGDLVDRGPASAEVLRVVGHYLDAQPTQWIQLAGNHEAQYLPGGVAFWREKLSDTDAGTLRTWWSDGRLQVAAAVRTADGDDVLLTHAGLTVNAWRALGEPMTAATAAIQLNARPEPLIWLGDGFAADTIAGPLWAEAGWELYEAWMQFYSGGGFVAFDQVHGHSSIVNFEDRTWRCPGRVRQRAAVDWQARHVRVRLGGRVFTGIDPKLGRTGTANWQPLVLDGAEVIVGADRFDQRPALG